MTIVLLILLGLCVFIQLCYYLFVFSPLARHAPEKLMPSGKVVGVSVLVCAWNELDNLRELLPLLNEQAYPEFEVILLDDRSEDGTEDYLREHASEWAHVRTVRIDQEYSHITPKKYALTVGMKHARYPIALMTDADCRPAGTHWLAGMAAQLTPDRDIVLGYSPYYREAGLLNWFIRCETFYTAVQYLSLARAGRPYMGVGRNLMYRTSLFFEHRGFYTHKDVMGGDDDLFMNQAATSTNAAVALDPETFVYSFPKTTWNSWFTQKKRHLSVGSHYRTANKIRLGLLSASHVGTWVFGVLSLIWGIVAHDMLMLQILGGMFALRWLAQVSVLQSINQRLDHTLSAWGFIPMDFALLLYYIVMSGLVFSKKKKKVAWR